MADIDLGLPIRTENPGDAIVKIADATTPSQQLAIDVSGNASVNVNNVPAVKLKDGAGTDVTSQVNGVQQALDVGINVAGVQVDPRSIRALTASDAVTAVQGTPNSAANGWPVKPTDGTNSQLFTASGEALVKVNVALPAGTNNIGKVSIQDSGGVAFSTVNPLPVSLQTGGTPICDYETSAALAAAGTHNHDYTVTTGKTLTLTQIEASGSAKLKIEVQVDLGSGLVTKFVQFSSVSSPNMTIKLENPIAVAATKKVRIIIKNMDQQAQDVYSTICGSEA